MLAAECLAGSSLVALCTAPIPNVCSLCGLWGRARGHVSHGDGSWRPVCDHMKSGAGAVCLFMLLAELKINVCHIKNKAHHLKCLFSMCPAQCAWFTRQPLPASCVLENSIIAHSDGHWGILDKSLAYLFLFLKNLCCVYLKGRVTKGERELPSLIHSPEGL